MQCKCDLFELKGTGSKLQVSRIPLVNLTQHM